MKCPTCGNDNPPDVQFCGGCGTNLISGEASFGTELPMVRFGEAIRRGFSNYFRFSGRSTRDEILVTQQMPRAESESRVKPSPSRRREG